MCSGHSLPDLDAVTIYGYSKLEKKEEICEREGEKRINVVVYRGVFFISIPWLGNELFMMLNLYVSFSGLADSWLCDVF